MTAHDPCDANHSIQLGGNRDFSTYEEPQAPLQPIEGGYVAAPTNECANGCHTGSGGEWHPVETEGTNTICAACIERLDTWLRSIPDLYHQLPIVLEHGTVPADPGTKQTKRPDPPAPMRLEVTDMLDTRRTVQYDEAGWPILADNRRGVFGALLAWAAQVRRERNLPRVCLDCKHEAVLHRALVPFVSLCRADCACTTWTVRSSVYQEGRFLVQHLAWIAGQPWVSDLYDEMRLLHQQLSDAVGERREQPIAGGRRDASAGCVALISEAICGGPLYRHGTGAETTVRCAKCGDTTTVERLQELGLIVGILSDDGRSRLEAS